MKSAKLAFFTFPNMNEKSDFETFHVTVIVLVRGQNDHLPQVDDLSTCGKKGIKNQVVTLTT